MKIKMRNLDVRLGNERRTLIDKKESIMSNRTKIYIVSGFHHDISYLKTCSEYLEQAYRIIDAALDILDCNRDYRFLIEQVFLLEKYLNKYPYRKGILRKFIQEGRLSVSPGCYVTADMNIPYGESLYMQIKFGKEWLREEFDYEPKIYWNADCWGHHSQLPQILKSCGYEYYVFWRCMRQDVLKGEFRWVGLDDSEINCYWLSNSYSELSFPIQDRIDNIIDLNLTQCSPDNILKLIKKKRKYCKFDNFIISNAGDMMFPQPCSMEIIKKLNIKNQLPQTQFGTPEEFFESVNFSKAVIVGGEFNSAFQGTFTSNIRIKQKVRKLTNRLLTLEKLSVLKERKIQYDDIWKLLLKQQAHDIICGTVADEPLNECLSELDKVEETIDMAFAAFKDDSGNKSYFNPLPSERTEVIEINDKKCKITVPGLSMLSAESAEEISSNKTSVLPCEFSNEFYHAVIDKCGYIASLLDKASSRDLVSHSRVPFGSLAMQMDYGDLWLNFESPLAGGSFASSLTHNSPDPYDRSEDDCIVNRSTIQSQIDKAQIQYCSKDMLIIKQQGRFGFWQLNIEFITYMKFTKHNSRIEFCTELIPAGKNYRIRAVFPSCLKNYKILHEIPFGIYERPEGEFPCQNFFAWKDAKGGLAVINKGIPAGNVTNEIGMITLLRSVAMEYKAPSNLSYAQGIEHKFEYAVMPFGQNMMGEIAKNAQEFNNPLVEIQAKPRLNYKIEIKPDNIQVSALRWQGDNILLRIYECLGKPTHVTVKLPNLIKKIAQTDLHNECDIHSSGGSFNICFDITPYKIVTYILMFN